MESTFKVGDIIKMHFWHGVIKSVFVSENGEVVLQVQTIRNIFRRFGPELIEVSKAPHAITVATIEDLEAEVAECKRLLDGAVQSLLAMKTSGN